MDAEDIIHLLGLTAHPEGGYYRETFRDSHCSAEGRTVSTLIYFLLKAGQVSTWHRIDAAEAWHHYAGAPLRLTFCRTGEKSQSVTLGCNLLDGERPQAVVPAGYWQTAECLRAGHGAAAWALVGCSVAPGFQFSGFEVAPAGWRPDI